MSLTKSRKVIVLESTVSFFLIYFNWIACSATVQTKNNLSMVIGITDFSLVFVLLFLTSFEYFSTFNPVVTLLLYLFKQIDFKRVTSPDQTAALRTPFRLHRRPGRPLRPELPLHAHPQVQRGTHRVSHLDDVRQGKRPPGRPLRLLRLALRPSCAQQEWLWDSSPPSSTPS